MRRTLCSTEPLRAKGWSVTKLQLILWCGEPGAIATSPLRAGASGPSCCTCCPGQCLRRPRHRPHSGQLRGRLYAPQAPQLPTKLPKIRPGPETDLELHSSPVSPSPPASPEPLPSPVPPNPHLESAPTDPRLRPTTAACQLTLRGTPLPSPSSPRMPCKVGVLLTESSEHFSISHPVRG